MYHFKQVNKTTKVISEEAKHLQWLKDSPISQLQLKK